MLDKDKQVSGDTDMTMLSSKEIKEHNRKYRRSQRIKSMGRGISDIVCCLLLFILIAFIFMAEYFFVIIH